MITLRKLEALPARTRARKLIGLLAEDHPGPYGQGLLALARAYLGEPGPPGQPASERERLTLRHRVALKLGLALGDWDLQAPADRPHAERRFPCTVYLDDLRSPFNVGSIVRTAEAYGFEAVLRSPATPGLDQPRARRTAMGSEAFVEVGALALADLREAWGGRPVFALELGGVPVDEFDFPPGGLVLLGGEELGLSPEALAWADASAGRVSLPLYGRKASLNVGVAFGVLAAAWTGALVRA